MPASHTINTDQRLINITCGGVLTDSDLSALQAAVLSDPAFSADYDRFVDVTAVTDFQASPYGIAHIANEIQAGPGVRYAIVADKDVAYGLARMYGFFAEGTSAIQVFRSATEACAWLEDRPRPSTR